MVAEVGHDCLRRSIVGVSHRGDRVTKAVQQPTHDLPHIRLKQPANLGQVESLLMHKVRIDRHATDSPVLGFGRPEPLPRAGFGVSSCVLSEMVD